MHALVARRLGLVEDRDDGGAAAAARRAGATGLGDLANRARARTRQAADLAIGDAVTVTDDQVIPRATAEIYLG
ncbi:MAG TPA: hypothetical protein VKF60_16900 [Myxococcota bacterium]|nr:hypothetical protein [Myxococcota bacterium]